MAYESDSARARRLVDEWLAKRGNLSDEQARELSDLLDDLEDAFRQQGADCASPI